MGDAGIATRKLARSEQLAIDWTKACVILLISGGFVHFAPIKYKTKQHVPGKGSRKRVENCGTFHADK